MRDLMVICQGYREHANAPVIRLRNPKCRDSSAVRWATASISASAIRSHPDKSSVACAEKSVGPLTTSVIRFVSTLELGRANGRACLEAPQRDY